jgi:hypothetical protein
MAGGMIKSRSVTDLPEHLFPWRSGSRPLLPGLIASAVGAVIFLILIFTVRIRVATLERPASRKAAVIYLRDDAQGRALSLRAREGGPFPSRFEPSQWEGMAALEATMLEAAVLQSQPYVPALPELPPETLVKPLEIAAKGARYFPEHPSVTVRAQDPVRLKLAPVLYPLAGISAENLPAALPAFESTVSGSVSSASWRFLVRLTPEGTVAECVSLEKGDEAGTRELESWLHRVQFKPKPAHPSGWVAIGIGFINQATDGTDAR